MHSQKLHLPRTWTPLSQEDRVAHHVYPSSRPCGIRTYWLHWPPERHHGEGWIVAIVLPIFPYNRAFWRNLELLINI